MIIEELIEDGEPISEESEGEVKVLPESQVAVTIISP